jgi:hypothetical protein
MNWWIAAPGFALHAMMNAARLQIGLPGRPYYAASAV